MGARHPDLVRLDALVGRWIVQPSVEGVGSGWCEFTWVEDGKFLRQFADSHPLPESTPAVWREDNPMPPTALIGLDDATEQFTMMYADARGVYRVYQMTFDGGVWAVWRHAPGFNQRYTGTLSDDGQVIDGQWEMSRDGEQWHVDFGLTYRRGG
ncbi:hypothetical protein [Phytohabitans kaempferiae]|uniref:DUF1579 domain-containing protein n=1 Tax=Phytohabitans kaempferiae TaxID=1620943 RepID=A0ABV6MG88_9ACTN